MADFENMVYKPSDEYKRNVASLQGEAQSFRGSMPQRQKDIGYSLGEQGRSELAQRQAGLRGQYNQRGLLYSGLRQGAESQAAQETGSNYARLLAQRNKLLEDQARDYEMAGIASGFNLNRAENEAEKQRYNIAMGEAQNRANQMSGIFGVGGSLLGLALANRMSGAASASTASGGLGSTVPMAQDSGFGSNTMMSR